jgi:2-C-methyl-D-erythritol 4-phosphate cytidylyltransferase
LERSVATALAVSQGVVVVLPGDVSGDITGGSGLDRCTLVTGAATRSDSVRAGLAAIPSDAEIVAVHDGARPLADTEIYERAIAAVRAGVDGAVPVVPLVDTIRRVGGGIVDRELLRAVQTPQVFTAAALRGAHASAGEATDDAGLVEADGGKVVFVEGSRRNIKITEPLDLAIARMLEEG